VEISKNPLISYGQKAYNSILEHKKEAILAASFVLGAVILSVGYSYYKDGLQRRAQKDLVEALKSFDAPVHGAGLKDEELNLDAEFFTSDKEKWTKVAQVFEQGYQKNKSAGIAPLFLAYQAQALINLGNLELAAKALNMALESMPESSARSFYKVKAALVSMDTEKKELQEQGLQRLKAIALDTNNTANPMALYYLGQHYRNAKDFNEAKNYWNQLVLKYGKTTQKPSVWAQKAKKYLKLVSVK